MIDVLVIGAGPAGLALAIDLARRGKQVRIVDRLSGPFHASKGKGIQPRTLEVFDDFGIIDRALAAGSAYPPLAFYEADKVVREQHMTPVREPSESVPYPNRLMLPQWKTEELLRDRLAEFGVRVEYGCDFKALKQDESGVVASLKTAEGAHSIGAHYLVAADGGRSAVRTTLGIPMVGETPNLEGLLVADVIVDDLNRDQWHFWGSSLKDSVTLCPLPSTDAFQFMASVQPTENPELSLEVLQAFLDARTQGNSPRLVKQTWMSVFRPNIRLADRFREGRVFLIGDAAHVHPPAGGQGLNTSIQDAYNLGWRLAAALDGADIDILEGYDEERWSVAAAVLGNSDLLYRRGMTGEAAAFFQRGNDENQLGLNYRGRSTIRPSETQISYQPGDRMPNAWLRTATGESLTLFDLMRGPQGVVLNVETQATDASLQPERYWTTSTFQIKFQAPTDEGEMLASGTALREFEGHRVSIRPDGYIDSIVRAAIVDHPSSAICES
jgi:2-polyprenyl-6-methoxyphenol hydroxylase-like FAD-dependent oxidoreductase